MKSPHGVLILLAALAAPTAHANMVGAARFSDAAAVFATAEHHRALVYDRTVSPASTSAFENISGWNPAACESNECLRSAAAFGRMADIRLSALANGATSAAAPDHGASDPGAMSAMDVGLMMLFAAGLLAYQLDRKHRVLRQSSLFVKLLSE